MKPADRPGPQALVLWVIWASLLSGMVLMGSFLWGSRGGVLPGVVLVGIGAGLVLASGVLRWVVIPKLTEPARRLPLAIVGMATAEACLILGLVLAGSESPEARMTMIVLGFLGVLQMAPTYLGAGGPRDFTRPG